MSNEHQIVLSADAWGEFYSNLTQGHMGQLYGISAFWANAIPCVSITRAEASVVVESSSLNEEAILSALCSNDTIIADNQCFSFDMMDRTEFDGSFEFSSTAILAAYIPAMSHINPFAA